MNDVLVRACAGAVLLRVDAYARGTADPSDVILVHEYQECVFRLLRAALTDEDIAALKVLVP